MTRKEAFRKLEAIYAKYEFGNKYAIIQLLKEIFDDFENEIYKNCGHCDYIYKICCNKSDANMLGFTLTEIDEKFDCNRFKKRSK